MITFPSPGEMGGRLQTVAHYLWSAILAFLFGTCFASWPIQARGENSPPWAQALNRVEVAYNQGHGKTAIKLAPDAVRLAHDAGSQQELYALREVQDICFRIVDSECASSYGAQLSALIKQIRDAAGIAPDTQRALAVEGLERLTRLALMYQRWDNAQQAAHRLEETIGTPIESLNFVQTNLTLARAALQRRDEENALRLIRSAWLHFLIDYDISQRDFLRYVAEFIDLFRATGQTKRALALSGIGAKTLGAFGPYYKYEAVALLFSEYPVLLDQNQPRLVIKFLQEASKEWDAVELDDQIHSYYRTSGLIALAVNCALTQSPDCSRDEALPELESYLNHVLNDYKGGEIGFMARDAATALALSAAVNHRTVPDVATTIIRLPPPSAETTDGADEQTIYFAGRYFLALATSEPNPSSYALAACRNELERIRRMQGVQPFNVAPLGVYSRVLFLLTAAQLASSPVRSSGEDDELLEMVTYLNRSNQSVESDYLYLLSETTSLVDKASLQVLHRAEQHLAGLEKYALSKLVDVLRQRKPNQSPPPVAAETWGQFGEIVVLIDSHKDARQKAAALARRQPHLLASLRDVLRPNERFVTHVSDGTTMWRICVGRDGVDVGLGKLDGHGDLTQLKLLKAALTNPSPPGPEVDLQFPIAASMDLSRAVLGDDQRCLRDAEHIVFAPDPAGLSLPFHILIDPSSFADRGVGALPTLTEVKWLGMTRAISVVVEAKQFVASRKLHVERTYAHAFLGIGDPRLRGNTIDGRDRNQVALRGVITGGLAQLSELDELPDTATELESLAKIFGSSSELLLGEGASELAVRRKFLNDYRVISFATHGLIREDIDGLHEAALLLTPRDSEAEVDDGLLTATEISQLDAAADLVILSACNSARFDLDLFGPEAASLSSAFFLAGAHSTLAALWSVDSATTSRLMSLFAVEYAKVPAPGASMALRNAIRKFISTAPAEEYRNPRFWAAFTLFGDGGAPIGPPPAPTPGFRVEPISSGNAEVSGGVNTATRALGGIFLSGYLDNGDARVIGQLRLVDLAGNLRWQLRDENRTFTVPDNPSTDFATVLAWNYVTDRNTMVELLTFNSDGTFAGRGEVSGIETEIIDGFLRVGEGRFALVTHDNPRDKAPTVMLRVLGSAGEIIGKGTIAIGAAATVKLIGTDNGFWVIVTAFDPKTSPPESRLTPIGSKQLCTPPRTLWLYHFSRSLELIRGPSKIEHMAIYDILELRPGTLLMAAAAVDTCEGGNQRSALIEFPTQGEPRVHYVPITELPNAPQRMVKDRDGSVIVIGSLQRNVDYLHLANWQGAISHSCGAEIRRESPYRQFGGYVARFNTTLTDVTVNLYFNGTDLFFNDIASLGTGWLLVGWNGCSQFEATLTPSAERGP